MCAAGHEDGSPMPPRSAIVFDAGLIRPPVGPLYAPPPYLDLAVSQVYINVNRSEGTMCAGAYVENLGGAPPDQPFKIAIAVSFKQAGEASSEEQKSFVEVFPIAQDVAFPFKAPCTEAPLVYRDLDPAAKYDIEVVVDPEYELYDLNRTNNKYCISWWILSPAMAKKTKPVKLDFKATKAS